MSKVKSQNGKIKKWFSISSVQLPMYSQLEDFQPCLAPTCSLVNLSVTAKYWVMQIKWVSPVSSCVGSGAPSDSGQVSSRELCGGSVVRWPGYNHHLSWQTLLSSSPPPSSSPGWSPPPPTPTSRRERRSLAGLNTSSTWPWGEGGSGKVKLNYTLITQSATFYPSMVVILEFSFYYLSWFPWVPL